MITIEVIGLGHCRTGTTSLKTALDILGLPCYHMFEVLKRPSDAKLWLQAAEGDSKSRPALLAQLLQDYKACTDWPANHFYPQLLEMNPDAKANAHTVILTVRDPDQWHKSVRDTIWLMNKAAKKVTPWYARPVLGLVFRPSTEEMLTRLFWGPEGALQGVDMDKEPERAKQLLLQHNEAVRKLVPPERLLVYEVSQGWGPLCAFLGKPIPDQPFPHVNEAAWFRRVVQARRAVTAALTYGVPAMAAAAVAGLAVVVARLWK